MLKILLGDYNKQLSNELLKLALRNTNRGLHVGDIAYIPTNKGWLIIKEAHKLLYDKIVNDKQESKTLNPISFNKKGKLMINIEKLMPLNPDKIILFGSYIYGEPNEDSDIDLFLLKDDLTIDGTREFQRKAKMKLIDIILNNETNAIDILSAPTEYIKKREDYFYKVDILQRGKVWCEQTLD